MSSPYTSQSVSGYNVNPPPDDGTSVATNLITWAGVKTKIGDPLNTFASSVNSALVTAFGKVFSGASVAATAVNYAAGAADQGRLIRVTAGSVTVTTPDATSVGSPFVFAVINNFSGGATLQGFNSGAQTIDGAGSIALAAGAGCILFSDGSNWFTAGQFATNTQITVPQGRLTLVSATPVMTADQSAATAVYYTPYVGNQIPIPNGSAFLNNTFAELTLTLNNTNYLANTIYDVFVFLNPSGGAVTVGTGPAWSTSTAGSGARGSGAGTTQLSRLNGLLTNTVSATMRNNVTTYSIAASSATYVGSIFIDGTNGQVTCHYSVGQNRKFGIWNAYNRNPVVLQVVDPTSSWTYNTQTFRASNNSSSNKFTSFTGLAEEWVSTSFTQNFSLSSTASVEIGIGINSTSSTSGMAPQFLTSSTAAGQLLTQFGISPGLGVNNVTSLEWGSSTGTTTLNGAAAGMLLRGQYNA